VGETTGIEWTDATWNPWRGCHKVSPACAHCYMFREQRRYGRDPNVVVRAAEATFRAPEKWKDAKKIFTCSWSDFFIEEADRWRGAAWSIIMDTKRHTYQILTKRPERMLNGECLPFCTATPKNVWLGVSVENNRFYDRIAHLQRVSAAVRFLSVEPLLGPVDDIPVAGLHWVIVGTESGPKARPTELSWIRNLRDRCSEKHVAFFVKQITSKGIKIPFDSWPEDLKVREFPA